MILSLDGAPRCPVALPVNAAETTAWMRHRRIGAGGKPLRHLPGKSL